MPNTDRPASVKWQKWGTEAFEEAQRLGRPILLSVTTTWGHRARQMDARAFADARLAALINNHFIAIRVDRDRRPDIDRRYQEAVQAISGSGGWPLTAVLTPEGEVIWGGTIVRVADDWVNQRPGLWNILSQTVIGWKKDRDAARKQAQALETQLRQSGAIKAAAGEAPEDAVERVATRMRRGLDGRYGGFMGAAEGPRFPAPQALRLALLHSARTGDDKSLGVANVTGAAMLRGGIHDLLGGGFHRFALDRRWRVPRFEKLLSVNAEMLALYVELWQRTSDPGYADAVKGIVRWASEVLADRERGGFAAAQAADVSPADDGGYYTWTLRELETALQNDRQCDLACARFDIGAWGELRETAPHRNVLFVDKSFDDILRDSKSKAGDNGEAKRKAKALILDAIGKLRASRAKRPAPPVDRGIPVNANARMISAMLRASAALGQEAWRALALKSLDRILKEAVDSKRGTAHWIEPDGDTVYLGLAADEAALALALEEAYVATGDDRYLEAAKASIGRLNERFLDTEIGAYRDRVLNAPWAPPTLGRLSATWFPYQDAPEPSVNAMAAMAQLRLSVLTGDPSHSRAAGVTLKALGKLLEPLGRLGAALLRSLDAAQKGFVVVVVQGKAGDAGTKSLLATAHRVYAPNKLVLLTRPGEQSLLKRIGFKGIEAGDAPVAHVRSAERFLGSVSDERKLRVALEVSGRP